MKIQPYSDNAKKHPDKQVKMIADSIKRFGWQQPIVVDTQGIIIVGHGRYMAWQKYPEGMDEPWIVDNEGKTISGKQGRELTRKEIQSYRLADNKLNESDWDLEMAIEELHSIDDPALQELTGFDMDLLLEPDEKDDVIPETPEEPKSKLGDLYELGNHRVLCGDSTLLTDVERLMDGKKADMVFTDPPYGVDYVSRVDEERRKNWGGIKNDDLKGAELSEFLKKTVNWFDNTYIFCNWQSYPDFNNAYGKPKQLIVWNKGWIGLGKGYRNQHEFLLFYGVLNSTTETNLWDIKRDSEYKHPTQKPVALAERAILNSLLPERIVYDPFLGSGSTVIAAEKTGRICYGLELDPKYVDVIVQRYIDYVDNPKFILNNEDVTHLWQKTAKKTA